MSVESSVNLHRAAKQARAAGPAFDIFHRLNGAQQNCRRMAFAFGHDVHAVIHSVDEINIGVTRRAEHDFGSLRPSLGRMCGQIVRAEISFDFNDSADTFHAVQLADKMFSEQFVRDENRIAIVK